jgi:hypothetical protein
MLRDFSKTVTQVVLAENHFTVPRTKLRCLHPKLVGRMKKYTRGM